MTVSARGERQRGVSASVSLAGAAGLRAGAGSASRAWAERGEAAAPGVSERIINPAGACPAREGPPLGSADRAGPQEKALGPPRRTGGPPASRLLSRPGVRPGSVLRTQVSRAKARVFLLLLIFILTSGNTRKEGVREEREIA